MDKHHPSSEIVKDPVCGMTVEDCALETAYEGIRYFFCSEQCRERFLATPHLYVGYPGHPAPGQRGVQVVKRRRFKLAHPLSAYEAELRDYITANQDSPTPTRGGSTLSRPPRWTSRTSAMS